MKPSPVKTSYQSKPSISLTAQWQQVGSKTAQPLSANVLHIPVLNYLNILVWLKWNWKRLDYCYMNPSRRGTGSFFNGNLIDTLLVYARPQGAFPLDEEESNRGRWRISPAARESAPLYHLLLCSGEVVRPAGWKWRPRKELNTAVMGTMWRQGEHSPYWTLLLGRGTPQQLCRGQVAWKEEL